MGSFDRLTAAMNKHAMDSYPLECVGIITKELVYVPCKNISNTPKLSFYLDPAALVQYDGNIWGIFHSHPGDENPIPSKDDKLSAAFNQYKFIVGFNNKFYLYWFDSALDVLCFEPLKEQHLDSYS